MSLILKNIRGLAVFVSFLFVFLFTVNSNASDGDSDLLDRIMQPRFDDLPTIRQTRLLRVLVCYSDTNYFIHNGEQRGFDFEMINGFSDHLNKGISREDEKIQMVFIPVSFAQLIPMLNQGMGDVIAAGMTVTEERKALLTFCDPYLGGVNEVLVSSNSLPELNSVDGLSGKTVYVPANSSYQTHLEECNRNLITNNLKPIQIINFDPVLETEDYLELLSSGLIEYTITVSYVAELWSSVLPNLKVHSDVNISGNTQIAWATRKGTPILREELNRFVGEIKKGTLLGNIFFKRYFENSEWMINPLEKGQRAKLDQYISYFKKYGNQYEMDWLKLAAQGFQESRLEQGTRSEAGAIGIMQLLPSTAKELGLDPNDAEQNIHAGAKYMSNIGRGFASSGMDAATRFDFALASYNAGPARVAEWRKRAAAQGFNPDVWFNNVEYIAVRETIRYVANVNKNFIAYTLSKKAGEEVGSTKDVLIREAGF